METIVATLSMVRLRLYVQQEHLRKSETQREKERELFSKLSTMQQVQSTQCGVNSLFSCNGQLHKFIILLCQHTHSSYLLLVTYWPALLDILRSVIVVPHPVYSFLEKFPTPALFPSSLLIYFHGNFKKKFISIPKTLMI